MKSVLCSGRKSRFVCVAPGHAAPVVAAGAHCGDRLVHVVRRSRRVDVGVQEAHESVRLVWSRTSTPAEGRNQSIEKARSAAMTRRARRAASRECRRRRGRRRGRAVEERASEVGLLEDQQDGDRGEADRPGHRHSPPASRGRRRSRRGRGSSATLPSSDGWKLKEPNAIQRFDHAPVGEREDDEEQEER